MKKYSMILFALLAVAFVAPAAFAQTGAGGAAEPTNWVAITSGFAMAIASAFCGMAQARATSSDCEGLARNPGAAAPALDASDRHGIQQRDGAILQQRGRHLAQGIEIAAPEQEESLAVEP
jgi:hypothetical protein